jgi:hypothetical protein
MRLGAADSRRVIREFNSKDFGFNEFCIDQESDRPLGQHYHRNKIEEFCFLEGGGTIRVARVDEDGTIVGEPQVFTIVPGFVISVPPLHTHRLDLHKGTRFVVRSSAPFDPDDMIACPILD